MRRRPAAELLEERAQAHRSLIVRLSYFVQLCCIVQRVFDRPIAQAVDS